MPNAQDNPDLYDSILLAGISSPGVVKLSGHDRVVNWDVKAGQGQQGATTTFKDIPPQKFTATFYLVKDDAQGIDDFADFVPFLNLINATVVGTFPTAFDIYHPDLASQNPPISSVCRATVKGTTHDGKGGQTVAVEFIEYRPAKKKTGTPSGAKTKKADPNADVKAELAALTKKYQATPFG